MTDAKRFAEVAYSYGCLYWTPAMFAMIQNDLMTHLLWVCVFLSSGMLEKRVYHIPLALGAPLHNFCAKGRLYPAEAQEGWKLSNPPTGPAQRVLWELQDLTQCGLLMTNSKEANILIYYSGDCQRALQEPDQPELNFNRSWKCP